MDLLVSLGSTLAFVYSVFSCIQAAATTVRCRPLVSAAAASATSGTVGDHSSVEKESAYHELIGKAEPQNFFDTCAMLICVVLLGKVQGLCTQTPK